MKRQIDIEKISSCIREILIALGDDPDREGLRDTPKRVAKMYEEVFAGMDECGYTDRETVKSWYDGFTFGSKTDIYNPWSILNYIDKGKLTTYWANTSSNSLVGKLIREGRRSIKEKFEDDAFIVDFVRVFDKIK